jgi:hypothetical protein
VSIIIIDSLRKKRYHEGVGGHSSKNTSVVPYLEPHLTYDHRRTPGENQWTGPDRPRLA